MEINKEFFERRTSVRRYERAMIPDADLQVIYAAILNTPTSYNGQQFSVIDVTSKRVKERLFEITGQKQIKTCSHFLVFCSDYYKINALSQEKRLGNVGFQDTLDGVLVGTIDATLAMANAMVAAHGCGLGTCCVGYVRTASTSRISQLLNLPKGVFVVCGLAVGIPRERPDAKPKQPVCIVVHQDRYDIGQVVKKLIEYDSVIAEYNKHRQGEKTDNDWSSHIMGYYHAAMSYNMLDYIVEQGYGIRK